MWNGDPAINNYVTGPLWSQLLSQYNVSLALIPLAETSDAVATVTAQVKSNAPGTIDLIWINGANFQNISAAGLLYGPFAQRLPSSAFYNWTSPVTALDFGVSVNGYEMPYNVAQFVFVYNAAFVGAGGPGSTNPPPRTMRELVAWIKGPGARRQPLAPPRYALTLLPSFVSAGPLPQARASLRIRCRRTATSRRRRW